MDVGSTCEMLSTALHCIDIWAFQDAFLAAVMSGFGVVTFIRVIMAVLRSSPL